MRGRSEHVKVFGMTKLKNDPDGNPRFDVYTSKGTFRTANNSSAAYQNPESWIDREITLHLDGGQITRVDA